MQNFTRTFADKRVYVVYKEGRNAGGPWGLKIYM